MANKIDNKNTALQEKNSNNLKTADNNASHQETSLADVLKKTPDLVAEETPGRKEEKVSLAETTGAKAGLSTPGGPVKKQEAVHHEATAAQKETDLQQEAATEQKLLQENYKKLESSLQETRKWGRELSQKLKKLAGQVESYKQDGVLTAEEAELLLAKAHHEENDLEATPLMHYSKIWDEELANIQKYSPDPDLHQHVLAFQHLLKNATAEEIEDLLDEFGEQQDHVQLTRLMLAKGKDYHQEVYKDLQEAGSLKGLRKIHESKLKKQQKEIEKLQADIQKLQKEQGYLPSTQYGLPNGSHANAPDSEITLAHLLGQAKAGKL